MAYGWARAGLQYSCSDGLQQSCPDASGNEIAMAEGGGAVTSSQSGSGQEEESREDGGTDTGTISCWLRERSG